MTYNCITTEYIFNLTNNLTNTNFSNPRSSTKPRSTYRNRPSAGDTTDVTGKQGVRRTQK
jgi:hypothetical protein